MIRNRVRGFLNGSHNRLLKPAEFDRSSFEIKKRKRIKIAFYAYILTTVFIVFFCSSLLIFSFLGTKPSFISNSLNFVSNALIKNNFMDLTLDYFKEQIPTGNSFDVFEGVLSVPKENIKDPSDITDTESVEENEVDKDSIYDFDYSRVPHGETPIIPMDLSLIQYGPYYIHNSTGLDPDIHMLLNTDLKYDNSLEYLSVSSSPTVLIVHTHGTEAYSKNGAISFFDDGSDIARSNNTQENVVAVGRTLKEALSKKGISSIHCEIIHDSEGYRDAYSRSKETIEQYLERYPTIKLVIDVHRDAVIKSSGELVRPVTVVNGQAAAQVMCVVGSNWGGESNNKWEGNLSLALKLRERLNTNDPGICRPTYLKASTYNQEIAPYSLLLEVGSCGNSLEEACVAAERIAVALAEIINKK